MCARFRSSSWLISCSCNTAFTEDVVEQIEQDHKDHLFDYAIEPAVKFLFDQYDHTSTFNEAWDELPGRIRILRQFCGGLATVFANTNNVESDFSASLWEKDEFWSSLTDLVLEGICNGAYTELQLLNLH